MDEILRKILHGFVIIILIWFCVIIIAGLLRTVYEEFFPKNKILKWVVEFLEDLKRLATSMPGSV